MNMRRKERTLDLDSPHRYAIYLPVRPLMQSDGAASHYITVPAAPTFQRHKSQPYPHLHSATP